MAKEVMILAIKSDGLFNSGLRKKGENCLLLGFLLSSHVCCRTQVHREQIFLFSEVNKIIPRLSEAQFRDEEVK